MRESTSLRLVMRLKLTQRGENGLFNVEELLRAHRTRIRKIADGRLRSAPEVPYVEPHNTWVLNHPGTLLVIPVGDLAQHVLAGLCYYCRNGICFMTMCMAQR